MDTDLTVRHRFDDKMAVDMVRIGDAHRNGIQSGAICRLTAVTNDGDGPISRYVEVKGIGTSPSDVMPYLEAHPGESIVFADFQNSAFMDDKTRQKFRVTAGKQYKFSIDHARLSGNCWYLIVHPDRYQKLLGWAGFVGVVFGVLGYTLKDWIAAYFSAR
jgi:hypothetical protein